jgi:GxxExxY protein
MRVNDPLTEKIIACAYRVHRELGPGFHEKVYVAALQNELSDAGLEFESEKEFRVQYKSKRVGSVRVDMVVGASAIIEVKAIVGHAPIVFRQQVISYLKASGLKKALLFNFGNESCEIKRILN